MSQSEDPQITEAIRINNEFCAVCPKLELGGCAIISGLAKLDLWNGHNPAVEATGDEEVELTKEQQTAVEIRPRVGELFVELVGIQTECVASMQTGGKSLQATAVTAISESGVASIAQRDLRA